MEHKTFIPEGEVVPPSQIGATLEALAATIASRKKSGSESYTHRLLTGDVEYALGKVTEEAAEVADAVREGDIDHVRYEAADVIYHLLTVLERVEIPLEELAAELNNRMTDDERPYGGIRLYDQYVNRGK